MTTTLLANCVLVDAVAEAIRPSLGLRIEGGRIEEIGTSADLIARGRTSNVSVTDLGGAFVLPGLINMHVHVNLVVSGLSDELPAERALRMGFHARETLEAGITTIRSTGAWDDGDFALREAILKGYAAGPRIFACGAPLLPTAGHGFGLRSHASWEVTDGADAFLRATRQRIAKGADWIKVLISGGIGGQHEAIAERHVTDEEMRAVTWVAHGRGKKVTGHCGPADVISQAIACGFDCIEHGYQLTPEVAREMAAHGTWLVPTLGVTRNLEIYRRFGSPPSTIEKATAAAPIHRAGFQAALAAGVRIAMGTDFMPAEPVEGTSASVREIELMVEAGMSPAAAIRAATSDAAACLGASDIGRLEVGMRADLIGVDGDPLVDVSRLRMLRYVMKDGVSYPAVPYGRGFSTSGYGH